MPANIEYAPGDVTASGGATESTLSQVRDALRNLDGTDDAYDRLVALVGKDFATQTTLADVLAQLQKRPTFSTATALLSVPSGTTYTTIVSMTLAEPCVVLGYNADFAALVDVSTAYRIRFILGSDATPDIRHGEELTAAQNSWSPVRWSVPANTRIAVQVVHGALSTQDFRATINYQTGG